MKPSVQLHSSEPPAHQSGGVDASANRDAVHTGTVAGTVNAGGGVQYSTAGVVTVGKWLRRQAIVKAHSRL